MTGKDDTTAPDPNKVDAMRLSLMLGELRLPTISQLWQRFAQRADKEGWTAARFLAALAEHELAERDRRRIERHLREAKLLPGKSLESFDFNVVPMISRAQVNALATGDAWLSQGANCLVFGPPSPSTQCTPRYVIESSVVAGSDRLFADQRCADRCRTVPPPAIPGSPMALPCTPARPRSCRPRSTAARSSC